ncbi:MAG TPA: hypothetical protein VGJ87_15455 [Roseiflexaceae bacterium]
MSYRADDWVRAESGAPELRQVITETLDATTRLIVVVVRGVRSGPPRVAEAPMCPTHNRGMKRLQYPTKLGHALHCTAKVGDGWCEERA